MTTSAVGRGSVPFWTAQLISSYRLSISPRRIPFVSPGPCRPRSAIAGPIVPALIGGTEDASRDHRARRRLGASSGSAAVSGRRRVLSRGAPWAASGFS